MYSGPRWYFLFSALLQDNVYVKSVSVAGTTPRTTWQKQQVTLELNPILILDM